MCFPTKAKATIFYLVVQLLVISASSSRTTDPKPKPWPEQFHSILIMKLNKTTQVVDLWYDWPNGRNFNIIQYQLGKLLYDLEWNNGTSFFYSHDNNNNTNECSSAQVGVGILRPNWLDGAHYLGQQNVDGFLCNVWEKADFITYYEDVVSQRPVLWVFYTGREAHVMTFEVGAYLEDEKWQVPEYCFEKNDEKAGSDDGFVITGARTGSLLDGVLKGSMVASS